MKFHYLITPPTIFCLSSWLLLSLECSLSLTLQGDTLPACLIKSLAWVSASGVVSGCLQWFHLKSQQNAWCQKLNLPLSITFKLWNPVFRRHISTSQCPVLGKQLCMGNSNLEEYELSLYDMPEPVLVLSHIFRHLGGSEVCSHPWASQYADCWSLAKKGNFPSLAALERWVNGNFTVSMLFPSSYHGCDLSAAWAGPIHNGLLHVGSLRWRLPMPMFLACAHHSPSLFL